MTKANSCRGHTTRVAIQNDDRDAATYRKRPTRGISDLDELCCPLCPKVEPRRLRRLSLFHRRRLCAARQVDLKLGPCYKHAAAQAETAQAATEHLALYKPGRSAKMVSRRNAHQGLGTPVDIKTVDRPLGGRKINPFGDVVVTAEWIQLKKFDCSRKPSLPCAR